MPKIPLLDLTKLIWRCPYCSEFFNQDTEEEKIIIESHLEKCENETNIVILLKQIRNILLRLKKF